jgi:hypothetical protein
MTHPYSFYEEIFSSETTEDEDNNNNVHPRTNAIYSTTAMKG